MNEKQKELNDLSRRYAEAYESGSIGEATKLYEQMKSEQEELQGLTDKYNESTAALNKLIMTGDDLQDIQKVIMN